MTIQDFIKYLLPEELACYFEPVEIKEHRGQLTICLDERNNIPMELKDKDMESKGFYPALTLEDFPIRDRKVYLSVRRRKWIDKSDGKIYSRTWDLKSAGTSYTKEFGAFLKEIIGYPSS